MWRFDLRLIDIAEIESRFAILIIDICAVCSVSIYNLCMSKNINWYRKIPVTIVTCSFLRGKLKRCFGYL